MCRTVLQYYRCRCLYNGVYRSICYWYIPCFIYCCTAVHVLLYYSCRLIYTSCIYACIVHIIHVTRCVGVSLLFCPIYMHTYIHTGATPKALVGELVGTTTLLAVVYEQSLLFRKTLLKEELPQPRYYYCTTVGQHCAASCVSFGQTTPLSYSRRSAKLLFCSLLF